MENNETHVNNVDSHSCVSGDTRIVLINPDGRVIYTNASYFLRFGVGTTAFPGWKILSTDGRFVDLINVSVNMGVNHINVIRASHGVIKVTNNQIVPIRRKCKYMELPANEVLVRDYLIEVPLKNMVREKDKLQEINLIDMIPAHSNISIVGTPKLAAFVANINQNISEENKAKILSEKLIPDIELDYYKSLRDQLTEVVDENELYLTTKKSSPVMRPVPAKYKLTREFGKFYGLLYSKGCVLSNKICIINSDSETIDFVKTYLAKLIRSDITTIDVKPNGRSDIILNSALFASLFKNDILGVYHSFKDFKLPNWFFFANGEFLKGFLSGIIDGSGYLGTDRTEVFTSSADFAEDIQVVCSILGYIVPVSVRKRKGLPDHIKNKIYAHNSDIYRARINNLIIVDMDLYDSIKTRKLNGYLRKRERRSSRICYNRIWSIEKCNFDGYVFGFETSNHYFAAGTQLLHDCTNMNVENIHRY